MASFSICVLAPWPLLLGTLKVGASPVSMDDYMYIYICKYVWEGPRYRAVEARRRYLDTSSD